MSYMEQNADVFLHNQTLWTIKTKGKYGKVFHLSTPIGPSFNENYVKHFVETYIKNKQVCYEGEIEIIENNNGNYLSIYGEDFDVDIEHYDEEC